MQHAEQSEQVAARHLQSKGAGMSDIVERLRNWRTVHLARLHLLMEEAADEMEGLRLSSRGDCPEPENAASEDNVSLRQNMTTLTSEERDVLREVCRVYADEDDVGCNEIAYVIDRILTRLGPAANSPPIPRTGCGECLTAAEREAVAVAAEAYADDHGERFAATLRALLERLG
jgi:hypothetical protein